MNNLKNCFFATTLAGVLSLGTTSISSGQSLLTNGNFTSVTTFPGGVATTAGGQLDYNVAVAGWTNTFGGAQGYNFVFKTGNAGDMSVTGVSGALTLYGPNSGTANGLTLPPGGGNVIGADGAYEVGPIAQKVSGLTVGHTYAVSFYWAGAQQTGYTGVNTESWTVALGGGGFSAGSGGTSGTLLATNAQTTVTATNASTGFTGWKAQTFYFNATNTSEILYFLANGTPTGQPPFSLIGDVSLTAVPEASSYWTALFALAIMTGTAVWRRFRRQAPATT